MLRQNTSALSSGIDIVLDFFLRLEFETLFFAEGRFFCTFEDDFVFFCLGLDFNIIKKETVEINSTVSIIMINTSPVYKKKDTLKVKSFFLL